MQIGQHTTLVKTDQNTCLDQIPFDAPPLAPVPEGMRHTFNPATQAVGVGYTPEGLDQNPAYYELLQEAAFKLAPEPNLTAWLVKRAHRRYGLTDVNADVASAWADLGASGYSNDGPVHDGSGVGKMPAVGYPAWMGFFENQPKPALCLEWRAWGSMISAASAVVHPLPKTFTYDLVDVGREVLSQLTIPVSHNFSAALHLGRSNYSLNTLRIKETGGLYTALLSDLDQLLATDPAFLLGTWLAEARKLGGNATDCTNTVLGEKLFKCDDFMEWNARAQLTTWHPVDSPSHPTPNPEGSGHEPWPGHINDYARKQWAGLVGDYYLPRVEQYIEQGLEDANAGRPFDVASMAVRQAKVAYEWQTDWGNKYPTEPVGDPAESSRALHSKYARFFISCD